MDDDDLYDEFGNYIGPDVDGSDVGEEDRDFINDDVAYDQRDEDLIVGDNGALVSKYDNEGSSSDNRIVLHEDKKYYPDAEEVYPGVRIITLDEDAQDLSEPIIKPIKIKNFSVLEKEAPALNYSSEFLASLMNAPNLIRNVAVVGHLHHGKTLFVDTLVQSTHEKDWDPAKEVRYTDSRKDEQERKLSIKCAFASLVLQNVKSKSYLVNILDCPGHVNFSDESTAALRAVDGAVIVVDAVEGVMLSTERLIKHALQAHLPISLVINKVDRLILELKLPPLDAYYKLVHTIEDANKVIAAYSSPVGADVLGVPRKTLLLSPDRGNVCFASAHHGWSFTLDSFASMYVNKYGGVVSAQDLAKRLWGDWYYNPDSGALSRTKPANGVRSFIQYVLEPVYKIYSQVIGESPNDLAFTLRKLGVFLKHKELHLDPKPLLKLVLRKFFGNPGGFVGMIARHVPSPLEAAGAKVTHFYSGYQTSVVAKAMRECDPSGPLMMHVVKLFNAPDGGKFSALARIYSGSVKTGQQVRVLGESYSYQDDEDTTVCEVSGIAVGVARFTVDISSGTAGNIVLLEGVDAAIKKTATITDMIAEDAAIFTALSFDNAAVVKLAVEPLVPNELPKLVDALRKISKSYPLATTKVEESGEHVIMGTGELYMDCLMHDLRHLYSDIEVKVADPVVSFCETVVETSVLKCFTETPNKRNKLTMIAEPLENGLAADIEKGEVNINWDKKAIGNFFRGKYDWDLLAARSIWAFGPDDQGPNILLDDTLPSEVDKVSLSSVRDSVIQGFKWGCREGPLCDEPIRNVKFKMLDATISNEPIYRGGGQIIPTARRTVYSSFLMASPRIMEPVYLVEIQSPADCIQAVYPVLARRRGHVVQDAPKPGAPFYTVKAYIPVMDSFGFETDLRCYTQGQAFCQQVFDHWAVTPGDPLDQDVVLHPLEPSPPLALARDFMIKSRRRKGLSEDVSISKYFDESMLLEIARRESVASGMDM